MYNLVNDSFVVFTNYCKLITNFTVYGLLRETVNTTLRVTPSPVIQEVFSSILVVETSTVVQGMTINYFECSNNNNYRCDGCYW